jgi:hypothetical protein
MSDARLHVEGYSTLLAIVRCAYCHELNSYLAIDATLAPVECRTCGQLLAVQEELRVEAATRHDIPGNIRRQLDLSDPRNIV